MESDLGVAARPVEGLFRVRRKSGAGALEWVIERYRAKTDKDSGIVNDPNTGFEDPFYVVDLLAKVVTVSVRTMEIVDALPPLALRALRYKGAGQWPSYP